MAKKEVDYVFQPTTPHFVGDGFRVHNFIPGTSGLSMQRMDPFIMLDYNSPHIFPPSEKPRGVDVHPHRGFETVTIAYKGRVEHHDSSGGGGIIGEGDVQWMTAASGVLHKEFHEKEWSKHGGLFQMVQLWVNLPAQHKMSKPKYQALAHTDMPRVLLPNGLGEIEIIAGQYEGKSGLAETFTPIHLYNAKLKSTALVQFDFPEHYTTAILVIEGSIVVNGEHAAPVNHFVLMKQVGEEFSIEAKEDTLVLILSGEPIKEPIAAHGPFVMNSREEIVQAFEDYSMGKFGHLE